MTPEAERIKEWRRNPLLFVSEVLHGTPDKWQEGPLRDLADPSIKKISLQACKNPGKTCVEAWSNLWFQTVYPNPNAACISYSGDQLRDNLWKELSKWMEQSALMRDLFTLTRERLFYKKNPTNWFISARQYSKSADQNAQASALAGLHSDYIMFTIDEAGDVPDAVAITAEAALGSGIVQKMLISGNPTKRSGPLWRAATSERDPTGHNGWKVYEVSGDPDDPNRAPRVGVDWARNMINNYGADHPWVLVNVFGKFPPSSFDALIGEEEVSAAQNRNPMEHLYSWSQKRIGVDVARFGDDRTVLVPRQGLMVWAPVIMRPSSSMEKWSWVVAERVLRGKKAFGSEMEIIDGTGGWGAGVVDALRVMGQNPIEINFAGRAMDPTRFANRRAEMYWRMSEWVKSGGCLPPDPDLARELSNIKYSINGKGLILLEPKELIKERIGESPDIADALALTFALPDAEKSDNEWAPGMREIRDSVEIGHVPDWDPWK